VKGIINTILRTPGCFLSPKNVLPNTKENNREGRKASVWELDIFSRELIGGWEGEGGKQ
jgi:hypothetical protein